MEEKALSIAELEHLPISYYRIGQAIEVDEVDTCRTTIAELTKKHIGYYFGQERNGARYTRSVSPEFVKPVLRPLDTLTPDEAKECFRLAYEYEVGEIIMDFDKQDNGVLIRSNTVDYQLDIYCGGYIWAACEGEPQSINAVAVTDFLDQLGIDCRNYIQAGKALKQE